MTYMNKEDSFKKSAFTLNSKNNTLTRYLHYNLINYCKNINEYSKSKCCFEKFHTKFLWEK